MYKPKNEKERIAHRLKISLGQLKKAVAMVEEGAYCIDVIHQTQAVQKALVEANNRILENHLKTCVAKAIRAGKDKQAIAEIMDIIKKA